MHTGPHTMTQSRPPSGGRGGALLVGGIAFAIVFLLIVGGTVGFLVLRGGGGGKDGDGTARPGETTTASKTSAPEEDPSTSASLKPAEDGEWCWSPNNERTSENPSGRLRGGGLEFVPPAVYNGRANYTPLAFTADMQSATAPVEASWASVATVGKVVWEDGVEYPGAEVASQRILNCFYANNRVWGEQKERTLSDEFTEPVTIAGMPGYRSSGLVKFGKSTLKKTTGTELVVVVVDTPEGPSMFMTDTAVGVKEHESAAKEAYESLTGLSG